jgi:hypothetical protein
MQKKESKLFLLSNFIFLNQILNKIKEKGIKEDLNIILDEVQVFLKL